MVQFKTPTSGMVYYRPPAGQYVGEFQYHADGPDSAYTDDEGNPKPTIRWCWKLYKFPSMDPVLNDDGDHAESDGLSSTATGPKSKSAGWFEAHLGRPLKPGEDMDAASEECKGKRVMLIYVKNGDASRLSTVLPFEG